MGGIVNTVTDTLGLTDSGAAAEAAERGAATTAGAERESLDYLKELDALPREFREKALSQLGNIFGFGDEGAQQEFYGGLTSDPFYEMIKGTLPEREKAFLRGQSATGDLRGGSSILGLGDVAQKTEREALAGAYQNQLQGIQSLMGTPSYGREIATGISGVGRTLGQGQIAAGQAQQDAAQGGLNTLLGVGKLASGAGWI